MTANGRDVCNGPRYALAIYDGDKHVGFLPWQGNVPVGESAGVALDLFHSELGVRSQARRRALAFAPLTLAPYDLVEHRPLDPIPGSEELAMPLKDEETREAKENPVPFAISKTVRRSREMDKLRKMTRKLISAQQTLARVLDRFGPLSEG